MSNNKNPIIVTGAAGFIGAALVLKLLKNKEKVIGIDNLNSYYDTNLKINRLKNIAMDDEVNNSSWIFEECDLTNREKIFEIFSSYKPKTVVNLAAQAGVRYSIDNPQTYVQSNILGFSHLLDACKEYDIENLIYASSSSVYGANKILPFKESHDVSSPLSFYAATKRSNELMAYSYSHIYNLPTTGLRFFTVYGPWGRPDMAPMIFTNAIFNNKPINIFNKGNMKRDFTYIDDVVEGILGCCYKSALHSKGLPKNSIDNNFNSPPYKIFNIGNSQPIELLKFIEVLESEIGTKAKKNYLRMQTGDVVETSADISELKSWIGFKPKTSIYDGITSFVKWYREYYSV